MSRVNQCSYMACSTKQKQPSLQTTVSYWPWCRGSDGMYTVRSCVLYASEGASKVLFATPHLQPTLPIGQAGLGGTLDYA
jgi:hypothetical protein